METRPGMLCYSLNVTRAGSADSVLSGETIRRKPVLGLPARVPSRHPTRSRPTIPKSLLRDCLLCF